MTSYSSQTNKIPIPTSTKTSSTYRSSKYKRLQGGRLTSSLYPNLCACTHPCMRWEASRQQFAACHPTKAYTPWAPCTPWLPCIACTAWLPCKTCLACKACPPCPLCPLFQVATPSKPCYPSIPCTPYQTSPKKPVQQVWYKPRLEWARAVPCQHKCRHMWSSGEATWGLK